MAQSDCGKTHWATRIGVASFATVIACALMIVMSMMGLGAAPSIAPPAAPLSQVPNRINDWRGVKIQLEDATYQTLDASDSISMKYSAPNNRTVFAHLANWDHPDRVGDVCPHHPSVCYRNTGWTVREARRTRLVMDTDDSVPIEWMHLHRGRQSIVVAFTYEMGRYHFLDDSGARSAQWQLLSESRWPSVTKYLVQTPLRSVDQDLNTVRPELEEILTSLLSWQADANSRVANKIPDA